MGDPFTCPARPAGPKGRAFDGRKPFSDVRPTDPLCSLRHVFPKGALPASDWNSPLRDLGPSRTEESAAAFPPPPPTNVAPNNGNDPAHARPTALRTPPASMGNLMGTSIEEAEGRSVCAAFSSRLTCQIVARRIGEQ